MVFLIERAAGEDKGVGVVNDVGAFFFGRGYGCGHGAIFMAAARAEMVGSADGAFHFEVDEAF